MSVSLAEPPLSPSSPITGPSAPYFESALPSPDNWERYVRRHPEGTLFHTLGWRDAVRDTFGHEPIYLSALRGPRLVGVLPLFLVKSRLAGRMLVSVPYAVGGGMLADNDGIARGLFLRAQRIAEQKRCDIIDLRSERAMVPELTTSDRYALFRRNLPVSVDDVLTSLPRKARAAARHARDKYNLTIDYGDEHLPFVWKLYARNMRRLGSINYPFAFFRRLIRHTPERHWVSVVRRDGKPVAGLVTFLFRDRVMPYFYGATDDALTCNAANFIYLSTMERGVAAGYRVFDFGRTRRDNRGSFDFKRFQGFEPRPLPYQRWIAPGKTDPNLTPDNPRLSLARNAWRRLPLCMTRPLGSWLARHIPG